MTESQAQNPRLEVRRRALDLLARREHSVAELRDKLRAKAVGDEASRAAVIGALVEEGLLSDHRFTESFVNARRDRGQGPLWIGSELHRRGIDKTLSAALLDGEADWTAIAREARRKRFGDVIPADYSERARQARFLRARGFTEAQALGALGDDE